MKRFVTGALAGIAALTIAAGCAGQIQRLEPRLELKKAAENLGAAGSVGFTLKGGGNVDDLIALARKESGTGEGAFTDEDADVLRRLYNSSFTIAWDQAGDGVADDKVLLNATVDGVTGAEVRVVDQVAYVKVPVKELAAKFGMSTAEIDGLRRELGAGVEGIGALIDGGWVSVAAADLTKLGEGTTGVAPSADPQSSEKFVAELKTSAERLLEGAEVVRDPKDKTHLIVTTSTVKAYEEAKRLVQTMGSVAGEAVGEELDKAPADRPVVLDLWIDNGEFKALEVNFLQFVAGNTGRATLRAEISTGAEIAAPGGATKLDVSKVLGMIGSDGPAGAPRHGAEAKTWAELVGSQATLLALTEGGKPAAHLKKAAGAMTAPGITVKIVRRGVAQVTVGTSVACLTVPASASGEPKVVEGAC